ncbi:hypothetical protein PVNG_04888 [Plasmodium vivax North Korean]|uniref:Uncharacterized protein n=1 Tax=Plasmodium vivax North Korean TaxID=1035514 RepID=A0A0J9U076_PLAVI|nr:hypothetical protein PVNG_04888 [Plasmodium vivax North Korean]
MCEKQSNDGILSLKKSRLLSKEEEIMETIAELLGDAKNYYGQIKELGNKKVQEFKSKIDDAMGNKPSKKKELKNGEINIFDNSEKTNIFKKTDYYFEKKIFKAFNCLENSIINKNTDIKKFSIILFKKESICVKNYFYHCNCSYYVNLYNCITIIFLSLFIVKNYPN